MEETVDSKEMDFGELINFLDMYHAFLKGVNYYFRYYHFDIDALSGYATSSMVNYLDKNIGKYLDDAEIRRNCNNCVNNLVQARINILVGIGVEKQNNPNVAKSVKYFKDYLIREGVVVTEEEDNTVDRVMRGELIPRQEYYDRIYRAMES